MSVSYGLGVAINAGLVAFLLSSTSPEIEVRLSEGPAPRSRRALAVVGLGLLLGLGGALVLRARSGEASRARSAVRSRRPGERASGRVVVVDHNGPVGRGPRLVG